MRASLAASTVTPGSTAPDESFTTPAIDACARAAVGIAKRHVRNAIARADLHISRLPSPPLPKRRLLICPSPVGVNNGNSEGRKGEGQDGHDGQDGQDGREGQDGPGTTY